MHKWFSLQCTPSTFSNFCFIYFISWVNSIPKLTCFKAALLEILLEQNLPAVPLDDSHACDLLKSYVLQQLKFLPDGTTPPFSNRLISAYDAISSLVWNDNWDFSSYPCVLMSTLTDKMETEISQCIFSTQKLFQTLQPPNLTN